MDKELSTFYLISVSVFYNLMLIREDQAWIIIGYKFCKSDFVLFCEIYSQQYILNSVFRYNNNKYCWLQAILCYSSRRIV